MAELPLSLYEQVVDITHAYLGPAADRFIARQVQNHLHKESSELSAKDLSKLIDWVRVAVSFITEDTTLIEEYVSRLQQLAVDERYAVKRETKHHAT